MQQKEIPRELKRELIIKDLLFKIELGEDKKEVEKGVFFNYFLNSVLVWEQNLVTLLVAGKGNNDIIRGQILIIERIRNKLNEIATLEEEARKEIKFYLNQEEVKEKDEYRE